MAVETIKLRDFRLTGDEAAQGRAYLAKGYFDSRTWREFAQTVGFEAQIAVAVARLAGSAAVKAGARGLEDRPVAVFLFGARTAEVVEDSAAGAVTVTTSGHDSSSSASIKYSRSEAGLRPVEVTQARGPGSISPADGVVARMTQTWKLIRGGAPLDQAHDPSLRSTVSAIASCLGDLAAENRNWVTVDFPEPSAEVAVGPGVATATGPA